MGMVCGCAEKPSKSDKPEGLAGFQEVDENGDIIRFEGGSARASQRSFKSYKSETKEQRRNRKAKNMKRLNEVVVKDDIKNKIDFLKLVRNTFKTNEDFNETMRAVQRRPELMPPHLRKAYD